MKVLWERKKSREGDRSGFFGGIGGYGDEILNKIVSEGLTEKVTFE